MHKALKLGTSLLFFGSIVFLQATFGYAKIEQIYKCEKNKTKNTEFYIKKTKDEMEMIRYAEEIFVKQIENFTKDRKEKYIKYTSKLSNISIINSTWNQDYKTYFVRSPDEKVYSHMVLSIMKDWRFVTSVQTVVFDRDFVEVLVDRGICKPVEKLPQNETE